MAAPFHPAVTKRAQELWELQGLRGDSLMMQLNNELWAETLEWTKNLPAGKNTRLPGARSTLNKMAFRLRWKSGEESDDEGPISGITDPIWHLSSILARKKAHDYTHYSDIDGQTNQFRSPRRSQEVEAIVFKICMDVAVEYEPLQKMFKEFRPMVREWVIQAKQESQDLEKNTLAAQAQIRAMAEAGLLDSLRSGRIPSEGLPVDVDHALLGMVYTNPDDSEGVTKA